MPRQIVDEAGNVLSEEPEDGYPYDDDDGRPLCFRCDGAGDVACHCGGDLCLCGQEDVPCPACAGQGHVSQEKFDRQIARHREIMTALWGEGWDTSVAGKK